jgi:hypothetical protein
VREKSTGLSKVECQSLKVNKITFHATLFMYCLLLEDAPLLRHVSVQFRTILKQYTWDLLKKYCDPATGLQGSYTATQQDQATATVLVCVVIRVKSRA